MHKKRLLAGTLAIAVALSDPMTTSLCAEAAEGSVDVSITDSGVSIENSFISREFDITDGHILTGSVVNKRIGTTLEPQAGSEDFIINTITAEDPDEGGSETPVDEIIPTEVLDRSSWKVTIKNASGTAFTDASAAKLIDGNLNTYPDEYTKSGHPFTVEIDLGSEQTVQSFSIDKRPGYQDKAYGINGTLGKFELYVSDDAAEWTLAGSGEFTEEAYGLHQEGNLYNVGKRVYANFTEAYTTRYVRLVQKSCALGTAHEFTSAELNLFSDKYTGYDWSIKEEEEDTSMAVLSSDLTFAGASVSDTENGKKLTINYAPYEMNDVTYDIAQVVVLEADDHYMRSFLEISVDDPDKAQIDYIDTDRFVLPEDPEGVWCHPDTSKISSMWIGAYELMLGQPIYVDGLFMGCEFPATDTIIDGNETQIRYYSGKTFTKLQEDHQLTSDGKFVTWQNVIGAAEGTDTSVVQTSFFEYIEEIATPTEFRKQYNSWYDNMMNITDESIASSFNGAEAALTQNGVEPLDSYVVDDGWNNYYDGTYTSTPGSAQGTTPNRTGFWEFNTKFPNELYTSSALVDKFQSTFGVWVGPQGGYNYFGTFAQYLEAMGTGEMQSNSALGRVICTGSRTYLKNFEALAIDYQNRFNVEYWKWDGFASRPCNNADHNHMTGGDHNMYFTSDMWEAWTDLFDHVRENNPDLFINATCYVNLSPWLLQWVNTIWVQDSGDTGQLGTGERHEQKIYYRDQVYYQLYKQNQIQFPLKNIYNHDPIYGVSDGSNATTEVFREFLFANSVRGTAFWELYYSPSIMDDAKWKVTADALAWAEENHDVLKNAKLFGNQPRNGVYGYSCWNGNEGIISFTNPLDSEQTYELTVNDIVGAPKTVKDLTGIQIEPYAEGTLENKLSYGDTISVTIQPHETLIYHYGHEDTEAPVLVSAKTTADNEVTVKFDERIQGGTFTVNGEEVTAELKEDYRTVVLTAASELAGNAEVEIADVNDFYNNKYNGTITVACYADGVIANVNNASALKDAEDIALSYDSIADVLWLKDIRKAYTIDTRNELNGTGDFSISTGVRTTSSDVSLFTSGDDVSLTINEDGFVEFKVKDLTVVSKETVTTVTEKAHGTFGTEEYVPTATETSVRGAVNDGEAHSITAVREANGMLKLYIDGALSNSVYDTAHKNEELSGGVMTIADDSFDGDMALIEVLNSAVTYEDISAIDSTVNPLITSDREGWTATACSEMPGMSGDAKAMAAIDGNTNSWWHTNYVGGDSHAYGTHWIEINFNREETFDQFLYTGRGSASNGSIKDYKLELLDEAEEVIETFEGAFSADSATTNVNLGKLCTAYGVRLTAVTTHNGRNFAAAVEINVGRPDFEVPADELEGRIEELLKAVEGIDYSKYTEKSAAALKAVVEKIQNMSAASEESIARLEAELAAAIAGLEEAPEPLTSPFKDVTETDYFFKPVLWAVDRKITDGWTEDLFAPEMTCTRGQLVTFLWRANGCPETDTESGFADVPVNEYYAKAVAWALENGITDGWTEDLFAPEMTVTRAQAVTFLWRANGCPEPDSESGFIDVPANEYYAKAVAWALENGITDGWMDDIFALEMPCTRGQVVTFLYRANH
ncbi:MAG: discoidin domain-containing protein [Lachnospiraceae bacterium]